MPEFSRRQKKRGGEEIRQRHRHRAAFSCVCEARPFTLKKIVRRCVVHLKTVAAEGIKVPLISMVAGRGAYSARDVWMLAG